MCGTSSSPALLHSSMATTTGRILPCNQLLQRGLLGVKVNLKVSLKLSVLTLIYQAGSRIQAYFAAIDSSFTAFSWYEWPEPLKNRHLAAPEEIYQSKQHFVRSG
ncbi:hypothetical protein DVH24_034022 [Malus domestica]|uniref:Uncharacterized protein n=1 Tax=Malus domestica TaxID=3750 RepID=A0A498KUK8_MALDO|nr:hypothetical protein DVH24_034022 [Malus domestica]